MSRPVVRLQFASALEMLDLVQLVSDYVARSLGMEEDVLQTVNLAIRESVINAVEHGNHRDASKCIFIEFAVGRSSSAGVDELRIRVRDQGEGFDPETVPDPLAPENLLKPSGRGIFLIRNFMDDVQIRRAPEGGSEVYMIKRVQTQAAGGSTRACE
jgi:serine/threonine-protein kinase RsbW